MKWEGKKRGNSLGEIDSSVDNFFRMPSIHQILKFGPELINTIQKEKRFKVGMK